MYQSVSTQDIADGTMTLADTKVVAIQKKIEQFPCLNFT